MPYTRETLTDLLAACASAPSPAHRGRAHQLLAAETAARLDRTGRDYRTPPDPHFAYVDAANSAALQGGADVAIHYFYFGRTSMAANWSGTLPRVDAPSSDYAATLAQAAAAAAQLRAEVIASMSAPAWTAARLPFVDLFGLEDFAANVGVDVARYAVSGDVAPGAAFSLDSRGPSASAYGAAAPSDSPPQISVAAPGAHRFALFGSATSSSSSPNASVTLALYDGATQRATLSTVRASSNPAEWVALGQERSLYLPGEGTALTIASGPIAVKNVSESQVRFGGVLLVWR